MNAWELIIQQPLINILIVFTNYLANNFGLAIIALTVIVNLAMFPLTLSQIRSSKAMQDLQPKIEELKKKYGKDRQKLAQEQSKLFKESGIASERNFGDGKARYEPIRSEREHHHHMICNECGNIYEFANNQVESCLNQIAKLNEFKLTNHKLEIYGLCSECREKN